MIVAAKGIVLKVVKYGETSIVCSIFTDSLGLQSFLVKGVRTEKKKHQKANIFRPGNILDLQVYHNEHRNLQYLKEYRLGHCFQEIGENVVKNTLLLFVVDALGSIVHTDDAQEELFDFSLHFLQVVDHAPVASLRNLPIYFIKELARRVGYAIRENYSAQNCYLNTYEGCFMPTQAQAMPIFDKDISHKFYKLIVAEDIAAIAAVDTTAAERKAVLDGYLHFFQWHDKNFKPLRSLPVLEAILH